MTRHNQMLIMFLFLEAEVMAGQQMEEKIRMNLQKNKRSIKNRSLTEKQLRSECLIKTEQLPSFCHTNSSFYFV